MKKLSILTFEPIFKTVVWGGRLLETKLDKQLPDSIPVGESWEVVDLPDDQSRVLGGEAAGKSLRELREEFRAELLGGAQLLEGRFPLLFKYIDAQQTLSVQVHPDEDACRRLGGGARPKTEAWYVIDCEPGAVLYAGLKPNVTREQFKESIAAGTVAKLLHELKVKPGDFVFLPSGTIHAIGSGILLAEVQQSSDTTYRVFDWNRVGLDGNPRQLHVEQALDSIAFGTAGPPDSPPPPSGRPGVACEYFVMETIELGDNDEQSSNGNGLLVLMGVGGKGRVTVTAQGASTVIGPGETCLIPDMLADRVMLKAQGLATVLATRIP